MVKKQKPIVLIGPTPHFFLGGIAFYTNALFASLKKIAPDTILLAFSRPYPSWLYPGTRPKETKKTPTAKNIHFVFDWANPFSLLRSALLVRKSGAGKVVLQWWSFFWAGQYLCFMLLLKVLTKAQIVLIVHNVYEHEPFFLKKMATKIILFFADKYIVHAEGERKHLKSLLWQKNKTIHIVTHPIQNVAVPPSQTSAQKQLNLSSPLLLFFGYIRPYKGLDVLLRALKYVKKSMPELRLIIAGEFWKSKKHYWELARQLGVEKALIIKEGYIPDKDVPLLFAAADAVVFPYRSATGTASTKLALAFNKPIIATRVGDIRDMFQQARMGKLVEPEQPKKLAEAIISFYQEDRTRYVVEIERFKSVCTWERLAHTIIKL